MIYFVACREANAVKIGICIGNAKRLYSRISTMQTCCPLRLELVAADAGNREEELALHERFAHLRIHGEWFRLTGELRDFVASVPPPPERPLLHGHSNRRRRIWSEESAAA